MPKEIRLIIRNPEAEHILSHVCHAVSHAIPEDWDYTVFLFSPPDDKGDAESHYASTVDMAENLSLFKQWIQRNTQ